MAQGEEGLYGKFHVSRVDGRDAPGGDKADARYFVLDYVHDPHARVALAAYAQSCRADYPTLAADLDALLAAFEEPADDVDATAQDDLAAGEPLSAVIEDGASA